MKITLVLAAIAGLGSPAALPSAPPAPRPRLAADDFEKELAEVRADLAEEVAKLAAFCGKKKWHAEEHRLYREVLRHDPENKKARKALAYEKDRKTDEWVQDPAYREPRNRARVEREELDAREAETRVDFRDEVLALVDAHADDVAEERRRAVLGELRPHFPDDPEILQRLGYVAGWEGRPWVMPEAKVAKERRDELKAYGASLREEAPAAVKTEVLEVEEKLGLDWSAAALEDWRAVTTSEARECDDSLSVAWAAGQLFRRVLDPEAKLPAGLTIYTLDGFGEVDEFLAHPVIRPEDKESLKQVSSWWLDWHTLAVFDEGRVPRMDGVSRQCLAWLLKDRFAITPKQGWLFEGFGLYLSYRVVGTRIGIFVRESRYVSDVSAQDLLGRLRDSKANWFRIAHEVLTSEYKPELAFFLGKDVNALTGEELLYGYALSAYLIEVLPEKAPEVLRRVGKGDAPATVLEEAFGRSLGEIETHLLAWLEDVKH